MATENIVDVKIVYIDRVEDVFSGVFIDVDALHVKITLQNRPTQFTVPWCNILKLVVAPNGELV